MTLLTQLSDEGRRTVQRRLISNLMIWLTTVSPSGRPESVPVWFLLREDETLLVYSQPGKPKLRNIRANPHVAVGLDVTDIGRDVIRLGGLVQHDATIPDWRIAMPPTSPSTPNGSAPCSTLPSDSESSSRARS